MVYKSTTESTTFTYAKCSYVCLRIFFERWTGCHDCAYAHVCVTGVCMVCTSVLCNNSLMFRMEATSGRLKHTHFCFGPFNALFRCVHDWMTSCRMECALMNKKKISKIQTWSCLHLHLAHICVEIWILVASSFFRFRFSLVIEMIFNSRSDILTLLMSFNVVFIIVYRWD